MITHQNMELLKHILFVYIAQMKKKQRKKNDD